jgi:hypothetical protein
MHHQPTDSQDPGEEGVSHSDISQAPEEIIAYWTPERMAEAKPREVRLPEPGGSPDPEPGADAGTDEAN